MVKKIELKATKREGKKTEAKQIRDAGSLPATLYGQGQAAENIKISSLDFEHAFAVAGESSLIDLAVEGQESIKVIVKDVQRDALRGKVTHVDLYKIDMKTPIETEIPIKFEGESKAEKELGGTLIKNMETIHIKSLPGDLAEAFEVDLSTLATFDDAIRVADIKKDDKITILSHAEDLIASVVPPRIVTEETETTEDTEEVAGEENAENKEEEEKEQK